MSSPLDHERPVTITHVISGDLWAGAEVQAYHLCRALDATPETNVTAVVFNPGILYSKLKKLGIPTTLVDEQVTGAITIARVIAKHCRRNSTDVVHTHGFKENILGVMGKELAKVPFSVRTVHGNPEHTSTWKRPDKWFINHFDIWLGRARQQAAIAVSSQLEQVLEPLFPGKVHKIFNFVDVDYLQDNWLPKPERASPQIRLGIVGRLVPVKRVDLFIRTISLLSKSGIDCKGIVIGDGPLRSELETLATTLNIADRIEFLGFVNPAAQEMRTLDALIMTSDHEGLPMTLLEALALEIPVIAHETGGIPEVLNYGENGYLVSEHSENGYFEGVKKLIASEPSTRAMTSNGVQHLIKFFSYQNNISRYVKIYLSIINNRIN